MLWLSLGLGLLSDASLMIFIQGASIPTKGYQPIGAKIQTYTMVFHNSARDIAAIPGCIKSGVGRIMDALEKKGVSNIKSVFFAGHSLGGSPTFSPKMEHSMIATTTESGMTSKLKCFRMKSGNSFFEIRRKEDVKGMVLLGSFLTRKYKKNRFPNTPQYEFPVPTLTVGGELDGLSRITRITESLHTQVTMSASKHPERELPVVVLPGVSHMQFASGTPPSLVKKRDLRAEVTEEEAHDAIASDVAAFLSAVITNADESWAKVELYMSSKRKRLFAFRLYLIVSKILFLSDVGTCERINHLHAAHRGRFQYGGVSSVPSPLPVRSKGRIRIHGIRNLPIECHVHRRHSLDRKSAANPRLFLLYPYYPYRILGCLEGLEMTVVDSSHIVTEERPSCHLPHIHGNLTDSAANPGNGKSPPLCDSPKGCTLNITTVTQQMYQSAGEFDWWRIHFNLSSADTGYLMESATELKAKLKSRQSIWEAAGVPNVNYTASDVPTVTLPLGGARVCMCVFDYMRRSSPIQ
eukprot:jgi/Bigna1/81309/fgenesh1_pg.79_\